MICNCAVFLLVLVLVGMKSTTLASPTKQVVSPSVGANQASKGAQQVRVDSDDQNKDVSLEIKIDTSRPLPYVGSGLGITAELKNKSKKSVLYLSEKTTTLTIPPEMEGPFSPVYAREAFFPSEIDQWRDNEKRTDADKKDIIVAIQPGYSYRAAWVQNARGDKISGIDTERSNSPWLDIWRQIRSEFRYVFFLPGEYKVFIQAKVGVGKPPSMDGYYTFSETANIKVAAPQFIIIFGAMIGGLISWLLFPQGQEKTVSVDGFMAAGKKLWWYFYSLGGACLLSAIVTILLARLSESQFLVKISVTDFWGALVVGFVAQYLGKSVLDKIIPGRPDSSSPGKGTRSQSNVGVT